MVRDSSSCRLEIPNSESPAEDAPPAAGTPDNSNVPNEGETAVQPPQLAELSAVFVAAPEPIAAPPLSVDPTAPAEVQPSFATAGNDVSRQTEPEGSPEAVPAATSGQKTAVSEAAIGSVAGSTKSEPVPASPDDLYVVTEEEQISLRLPPTPVAPALANGSRPQWRRPAGPEATRPVRETTVSGVAGSQDSTDDRGSDAPQYPSATGTPPLPQDHSDLTGPQKRRRLGAGLRRPNAD